MKDLIGKEIKDAALYNLEVGEFGRGGSTITQQLAKNLYLLIGTIPTAQGPRGADHPFPGATPDQAANPELYLNVAEWGQGGLRDMGGRGPSPLR
ncbi:MAG: transglycosylase domain-containing protein [Nitrospiraceae bacterium]